MQWAYLFERFPSFTQTFCYREVVEMLRQDMAPWIFSARQPRDEPAQSFPAGLAGRVRYVPEDDDLKDEFRWLRRGWRIPETLETAEDRFRGGQDIARVREAGWLGAQMQVAGVRHVHAHFAGIAARTAYWLHRGHRFSYSFTAHANDVFCAPEPGLSVDLAELFDAAKFVVTVSDFSADLLRQRFPAAAGKIHRVYNGIDTRAFPPPRPAKNRPRQILAVGRYIEKKGFGDLIAACQLLAARAVDFECRIVGEGPLEDALAAAIGQAGLGGRVLLTGPLPMAQIVETLRDTDVFALPCVREADGGMDNLPTVIAEAMAAGLPVVSTTLAGVPEMVAHGRTGLLVPPNSPVQLAEALERLLANAPEARAFGQAGLKAARRRFDLRATTAQLKRLLVEHAGVQPVRVSPWQKVRRLLGG